MSFSVSRTGFTFTGTRWVISSPWWAIALLFTGSLIFASLGMWQLNRFFERSHYLAHLQQQGSLPALALAEFSSNLEAVEGRMLRGMVHPLPGHTLFLDNALYQGRPGYRVYQVAEIDPSRPWVLLDRGWVPLEGGRELLPVLPDLPETVIVTGLVIKPMYNHLVSAVSGREEIIWPIRVQSLDIPWISEQLDHSFTPWVLDIDRRDPLAFTKNAHTPWLTPLRHQVYALQWLSFLLISWGFWGRFSVRLKEST